MQKPSTFRIRKVIYYLPFLFAISALLFVAWSIASFCQTPYIGAYWSNSSGIIYKVSPGFPAAEVLRIGDEVIRVDGKTVWEARTLAGKKIGDRVDLTIKRDGKELNISLIMESLPGDVLFTDLIPFFIGIVYILLSIVILVFSSINRRTVLLCLFFQFVGIVLGTGSTAGTGELWVKVFYGVILWWGGPVAVHAHLYFPEERYPRLRRYLVPALYAVPAIVTLLYVFESVRLSSLFRTLSYGYLAINLLIMMILLILVIRKPGSFVARYQAGAVVLGGIIGFSLLISFAILPEVLFTTPVIPYELAMISLILIPISYTYAILRHKLIRLDKQINQGAAFILVIILLGGIYTLLYYGISQFLSIQNEYISMNLTITLLISAISVPMYHSLQRGVHRILYGGWYDYQSVVHQVNRSLFELSESPEDVSRTFSESVTRSMQLESARLILCDEARQKGCPYRDEGSGVESLAEMEVFFSCKLCEVLPGREGVEGALISGGGDPGRQNPAFIYPLRGRSCLGLFVIGKKKGGEPFDDTDIRILEASFRQAIIVLENFRLLESSRQSLVKIQELHDKLLQAREDERKRIARNLHDRIIQAMIGLNYELSGVRKQSIELELRIAPKVQEVQEMVKTILEDIRSISSDLRPPALDAFGLVTAIRHRVTELGTSSSYRIQLNINGKEYEERVKDSVALCTYRVMQEAMVNIQKHARATQVNIDLSIKPDELVLSIRDNGVGFIVPEKIEALSMEQHFGLVGIKEMLEAVNGKLLVQSNPGDGSRLEANIQLN